MSSSMTEPSARPDEYSATAPRELSGKWVVIGVFAFAILMTAGLWLYWKLHIAPFLPLQQALAGRFEDSRPRVEGGQRKLHENTPRILRITMKVEFDPESPQADEFAAEVAAFVRAETDLSRYDVLELHLYHPQPEKDIRQRSVEFQVNELSGSSRK